MKVTLLVCTLNEVEVMKAVVPRVDRGWVDVLRALKLDRDTTHHLEDRLTRCAMGCEPLLSMRFAKDGLPCAAVPADGPPRLGGARKLRAFLRGCGHLIQLLRERLSARDPQVVAALAALALRGGGPGP